MYASHPIFGTGIFGNAMIVPNAVALERVLSSDATSGVVNVVVTISLVMNIDPDVGVCNTSCALADDAW